VESSPVQSTYRGRLAPSPTGFLHLGHARTFWTAYRRTVEAGGTLVLRIEDLDPQRSRPEYAAAAIEDLRWLGIRWSEGPEAKGHAGEGPYGPYIQSQRYAIYSSTWERLRRTGAIYPCRCSRRELAEAAQAPHEGGETDEPVYSGKCRPALGSLPANENRLAVNWRFRVRDGEEICFVDGHYGPQRFTPGRDFGDFLVWRRDGVPAYQLAVVADDSAMRISEVVRGADLLKSTARQILLYRALGIVPPAWYHCPLVRDSKGGRLAKRADALSIRVLRERGFLPQQVLLSDLG
jgi:glutamyl-tRNA synthetase